jgi:hypothetical protein
MALRLKLASSSLIPPLRKTTPTNAGGTVLDKAATVLEAISSAVTVALLEFLDPGVTMFGFKRHPSRNTLLSAKHLNVSANTYSVTF